MVLKRRSLRYQDIICPQSQYYSGTVLFLRELKITVRGAGPRSYAVTSVDGRYRSVERTKVQGDVLDYLDARREPGI